MKIYNLMSYKKGHYNEEKAEWLYTHPELKDDVIFREDVEFLITKYKENYFALHYNKSVGGYSLLEFISTKLCELGYIEVEFVTCKYDNNNIQDLKDKFKELNQEYSRFEWDRRIAIMDSDPKVI